jgi:hypothetical protein
MYAQGRLLVSHYPIVPLAFEFGLSFAVFSYNQRMFVGAIADAAAVDDLEPLISQLERAFADLRSELGVQERAPVDVVRPDLRRGRGAPQTDASPERPPASSTRPEGPGRAAPQPRPVRKRRAAAPPAERGPAPDRGTDG